MSPIILYTTECPKCKILETKLNSKNIKYMKSNDVKEMIKLGYKTAPLLKIEDNIMEFTAAIQWVNSQPEEAAA